MKLTREQIQVLHKVEGVILRGSATRQEIVAAIELIDALGLRSVSLNIRHMARETHGIDFPMPANDKAVRPEAPPPTVSKV